MDYAMAQTSLAHTYGNVTSFITEYVKNLFPKNYFKTVHVSSTIAYRQFNIFQNKNQGFLKKNKPMLIIRPRVEINESDSFLYGTYLTTRIVDSYMDIDGTNLQPFFEDKHNQRYIKFLMNRLTILFDITIITETQMEQLNQAHFLKNRIRQDRPFFLQTSLESYIPKDLMELISKDAQIPLYDVNNDNSVRPFLEYINGHSAYPVSYKIKNSTGNDEFFRYYPVNIDTMFTGLSIDDGSKKGVISDAFATNFTVSTEFNAAGLYYYFTENKRLIEGFDMSIEAGDDKKIIPIFTISNLYDIKAPDGWNLYTAPMYQVEKHHEPDYMEIGSLFNNSLQRVIEYHRKHGLDCSIFIHFTVMKDNTKLFPKRDYDVDLDNLVLITKNSNIDSTYRLIIHVNTLYINELLLDIMNLENEK